MDRDGFWRIIDSARADGKGKQERVIRSIGKQLTKLGPEEIAGFQREMDRLMGEAYRWDLWGAAFIMQGGCSDDGFEYFRAWLLLRGRAVFEGALADVESLAAALKGVDPEEMDGEEFLYLPAEVYEEITEEEIPYERGDGAAREPAGERWEEEELEGRFPRLWKAFGA